MKQVRLRLTDLAAPRVGIGGSLFESGVRRGEQTLGVLAADEGAGIRSTRIVVNGIQAGGDDRGESCHPLPGGLTSSLSPFAMVDSGLVTKKRQWFVTMHSDLGGAARKDFTVFAYCLLR